MHTAHAYFLWREEDRRGHNDRQRGANVDIVDIRWYANGTPTKKGVRMNIEEMKDVAKALNKIIERNKNEYDKNEQDV